MSKDDDPTGARLRHLDLLADAAIRGLSNENDQYLAIDPKRPFGFSGTYGIAASVLEIVGIVPDGANAEEPECYSESQYQYAFGLSGDLPGHIRMRWAEFRAGQRQDPRDGRPINGP